MWIALLFLIAVSGAELNIRTLDETGRPLAGVSVTVRCWREERAYQSDRRGMIRATYPRCAASSVTVQKDGYETSTTIGLRDVYRLNRIDLDTEASVRKFLRSNYKYRDNEIFRNEARLRPILRRLAEDRRDFTARHLLALIAEPSDLRLLLKLRTQPEADAEGELYALACSLIALKGDKAAMDFLQRSASEDGWLGLGATQSLKLMRENVAGPDLESLAERAALAIGAGEWQRNSKPQFNQANDKALIEMTFYAGWDMLVYTATFHKSGRQWSLRGARLSSQSMMPPVYVPPFEPPPQLKPQQP